jgi:hypothetical protein
VEVKIGIQSIPRELIVETNLSAADVEKSLIDALTGTDGGIFRLPDDKGGKVLLPADKIAYVEFSGNEERRIGFGSM